MVARFKHPSAGPINARVEQLFLQIRRQCDKFLAMGEIKGFDVDSGLVDNFARPLDAELEKLVLAGGRKLREVARVETGDPGYDVAVEVAAVRTQLCKMAEMVVEHYGTDGPRSLRYKPGTMELEQVPISPKLRAKLVPELEALRDLIEPE